MTLKQIREELQRQMQTLDPRIQPGAQVSLRYTWPSDGYTVMRLNETGVSVKRGGSIFSVAPDNIILDDPAPRQTEPDPEWTQQDEDNWVYQQITK